MTRECKQDFLMLKQYIASYSISSNLAREPYLLNARKMHKAYFSLVNWQVEFHHQISFFSSKYSGNQEILLRLTESISDIGSSKFNWLNGSYKASRVMLRSSIENFVRAVSAIDYEEQLKEKNVHKLFKKASNCDIFNSSTAITDSFQDLHSMYKELCEDTHTASRKNMENITSLADYPKYIEEKSTSTGRVFIKVVKSILIILCICFNDLYHKMHHKNKENVLSPLPKNIRPLILAPSN